MGMCEACPNRALMNLNRSLGNDEEARRIETAGCNWWWGMNYKHTVTKLEEVRYECGIRHVGGMIKDQGALVQEALQTAQSVRNVVAGGLQSIETAIRIGNSSPLDWSLETPINVREEKLLCKDTAGETS